MKNALIIITIALLIALVITVFFFSSQDDKINKKYNILEETNTRLAAILSHMENDLKTNEFTITTFSELSEKWAKSINSFTHSVLENNKVSNKSWDKIKYFELICVQCKNMIQNFLFSNKSKLIFTANTNSIYFICEYAC